ncbi:MAG: hypothetical protein LUD27_06915 [Clostridia bacterium]|nr:hypothetical protein [Clostridia bacterium]
MNIEILELFSRYGIDAAILSAVAAAIAFSLDRFVFEKLNLSDRAKRLAKLTPYALGIVFYAIYGAACKSDLSCFFECFAEIVKEGLAIGTLAFMLRLLLERFLSGKQAKLTDSEAVAALLDGYISGEDRQTAAGLLCEAAENGESGSFKDILLKYAAEGVTEAELEALAQLIVSYFNIV